MDLADCLQAALSNEPQVRLAAEQCLGQLEGQQGFGQALGNLTLDKQQPLGLRQLGAVLVKQYVKKHWQEGEKDYTPPTASLEDKNALRSLLPQALGDEHAKIRTAVGMAMATMARSDWPEEWPNLMDHLLTGLRDHSNTNKVNGSLRCLGLFADDLDDTQVPTLMPILSPNLYVIVDTPQVYGPKMQQRSLSIMHSCISTLGSMRGVYQKEARDLMAPLLKPWLEKLRMFLSSPIPSESPELWSVRMEALKLLGQVIQFFPDLIADHVSELLGALWQSFTSGVMVYERAAVNGMEDAFSTYADSDGCDQSLEALIIQLFETVQTVVSNARFKKMMTSSTEELVYHALAYMRITEEQMDVWTNDVNRYLADEEDDTYNVRVLGEILLEELVFALEDRALKAITDAVYRRLVDAESCRNMGLGSWWKWREAAFLALGNISDSLVKEGSGMFDVDSFVDNVLLHDLQTDRISSPFLTARAHWVVSRFSDALSRERLLTCLQMAVLALNPDRPVLVKLGGCHAIAKLVPLARDDDLRPFLNQIYVGLGTLFADATEETLHLVLTTLTAAVEADDDTAAEMEASLSPAVLRVWSEYVSNPLIHQDAMDLLKAIADVSACITPLMSRVVPTLATILANAEHQPLGLVDAALDLLNLLIENAPLDLVRGAHNATFASIIKIAMESKNAGELQSAEDCLGMLIRRGGQSLLEWGGNSEHTLQILMQAASRLLDPNLEPMAALNVGNLIMQLILRLRGLVDLPLLVSSMIRRMASTDDVSILSSLILVFARLVHMSSPNVSQLVDMLYSLPSPAPYNTALDLLMTMWTKHHGDIRGAYQIKISTTALTMLLSSRDARLLAIKVPGYIVKESNKGIITRSQAKANPDKWTEMGLLTKILALLADEVLQLQEADDGAAADEDGEEDWEEVDSGGEEGGDAARRGGVDNMAVSSSSSSGRGAAWATLTMRRAAGMDILPSWNLSLTEDQLTEFDDDEDSGYREDPDAASDPINNINLIEYIGNFIHKFVDSNKPTFEALCQDLSKRESEALQRVWQRQ